MDEQELNKKLAKWAGFYCEKGKRSGDNSDYEAWFVSSDKAEFIGDEPPNFSNSLDDCFKWLVPKAIDKIMGEQGCSNNIACAILFKKWLQQLEQILPIATLALCLAIKEFTETKKEENQK